MLKPRGIYLPPVGRAITARSLIISSLLQLEHRIYTSVATRWTAPFWGNPPESSQGRSVGSSVYHGHAGLIEPCALWTTSG
jgi:hypothetical protein